MYSDNNNEQTIQEAQNIAQKLMQAFSGLKSLTISILKTDLEKLISNPIVSHMEIQIENLGDIHWFKANEKGNLIIKNGILKINELLLKADPQLEQQLLTIIQNLKTEFQDVMIETQTKIKSEISNFKNIKKSQPTILTEEQAKKEEIIQKLKDMEAIMPVQKEEITQALHDIPNQRTMIEQISRFQEDAINRMQNLKNFAQLMVNNIYQENNIKDLENAINLAEKEIMPNLIAKAQQIQLDLSLNIEKLRQEATPAAFIINIEQIILEDLYLQQHNMLELFSEAIKFGSGRIQELKKIEQSAHSELCQEIATSSSELCQEIATSSSDLLELATPYTSATQEKLANLQVVHFPLQGEVASLQPISIVEQADTDEHALSRMVRYTESNEELDRKVIKCEAALECSKISRKELSEREAIGKIEAIETHMRKIDDCCLPASTKAVLRDYWRYELSYEKFNKSFQATCEVIDKDLEDKKVARRLKVAKR